MGKKSLIAKIAIKWGIQNTDNEQMAYELKGEDFLPQGVANLVEQREMALRRCQIIEEGARVKVAETSQVADEPLANTSTAKFGDVENENNELEIQLQAEREYLERELRNQECKLSILNVKIEKSAKQLAKLNSSWQPAEQDVDLEIITEEERECLRKIGLKLNSCLVLGTGGVFNGVIEGVHQHWKHREVVKVITMQRVFLRVIYTAKLLVAETGGILVSVEKLKEGYAMIICQGKNYRRPLKLMTYNLLTKREALQKSIQLQRIGALSQVLIQRVSKLELLHRKNFANTECGDLAQGPESSHVFQLYHTSPNQFCFLTGEATKELLSDETITALGL
ncbi:hypothetical protein PTKIN_Ptkin10aG0199000 [Pterospermum kingtungense]